ncbi:Hypothetical protein, putative [Bodo saltans]|uniref:Membrane-associated protein n=1 Tax=Bodo saltans TaxID=75058 RepID=A0A0S4IPK5_BODSA|nr:Hypothetical protein, putative [Bodo saltans]|eukprot:CUF05659.1 Hypothetical protein, putative [Bodo saltans]
MRCGVVALVAALLLSVTAVDASSAASGHDNRLGKWVQLDKTLQARMFTRMEAEHIKARADADPVTLRNYIDPSISVAWAYVQKEVCLKGGATFLANVKASARCSEPDVVRKSGRRACKAAGIIPGDVLLANCTQGFVNSCPRFFSVPGQSFATLCDEAGMGRYRPPGRKDDHHYEL